MLVKANFLRFKEFYTDLAASQVIMSSSREYLIAAFDIAMRFLRDNVGLSHDKREMRLIFDQHQKTVCRRHDAGG